jgi:FMN phosphatase YigB (HAD superfamily)
MANNGEVEYEYLTRSEIRVVTFDLDNTLWNTSGCIDAANSALAAHLEADNIVQPKRVEKVMGDLFKANHSRYCPLDENAKAPCLLTQLRTDAIQVVLEDHNGRSPEDALAYAQNAFQIWTNARHDAIPHNFATSVLACLEKVSSIRTSAGHPVLIGAITDGNSDPRNVDVLRDYFDFCVNAESIGVGKPDKRVYMEAIRYVAAHPSFKDLVIENREDEEELENSVGPYWVHVGDDFVKDIVAAKSLKMRSIWATELIRDKLAIKKSDEIAAIGNAQTRDVEDFVKDIADKSVVEMSIGADSYLADTMTREFVDAVTEEFHHLSDLLLDWHEKGTSMQGSTTPERSSDEEELTKTFKDLESITKKSDQVDDSSGKEDFITVVLPDKDAKTEDVLDGESPEIAASPRAFRLVREECNMDVPAPMRGRDTVTMKDVMGLAQMDKSSGVFAFPADDVQELRVGKMILMVKIGGADLQFSREIFVGMTVQDVLSLTDQNPITLTLSMKKAADSPSFDLF